jgi:hypothetical protein
MLIRKVQQLKAAAATQPGLHTARQVFALTFSELVLSQSNRGCVNLTFIFSRFSLLFLPLFLSLSPPDYLAQLTAKE